MNLTDCVQTREKSKIGGRVKREGRRAYGGRRANKFSHRCMRSVLTYSLTARRVSSAVGLSRRTFNEGVGGADTEELLHSSLSLFFFSPFCRGTLRSKLRLSLKFAFSSLLSRVRPHLAHRVLSVGFIRAHSEQCHCNTDAIEPILYT